LRSSEDAHQRRAKACRSEINIEIVHLTSTSSQHSLTSTSQSPYVNARLSSGGKIDKFVESIFPERGTKKPNSLFPKQRLTVILGEIGKGGMGGIGDCKSSGRTGKELPSILRPPSSQEMTPAAAPSFSTIPFASNLASPRRASDSGGDSMTESPMVSRPTKQRMRICFIGGLRRWKWNGSNLSLSFFASWGHGRRCGGCILAHFGLEGTGSSGGKGVGARSKRVLEVHGDEPTGDRDDSSEIVYRLRFIFDKTSI
jgi:hypothetical protein